MRNATSTRPGLVRRFGVPLLGAGIAAGLLTASVSAGAGSSALVLTSSAVQCVALPRLPGTPCRPQPVTVKLPPAVTSNNHRLGPSSMSALGFQPQAVSNNPEYAARMAALRAALNRANGAVKP
jgi:hypothetical protein